MSHSRLSAAVALGILAAGAYLGGCPTAFAVDVGPGQTLVVNPGDYPSTELFNVNSGRLDIRPGVFTRRVVLSTGSLIMDGAIVQSTFGAQGITASSSDAVISNSSISSPDGFGVGTGTNLGAPRPSMVVLSESSVSGALAGVSVSGGAQVSINASTIDGKANSAGRLGYGVLVQFGRADIAAGSTVSGDLAGVSVWLGQGGQPSGLDTSTFGTVVDGSRIVGRSGPAIEVLGGANRLKANVTVRNGAELIGGNGNLVEVVNVANLDFLASNVLLEGNILVADAATAALTFTDNAILNGIITGPADTTVTNGASWNLTGDSSIGDLTLGSGGTVKLGDGTAFNTLNVNGDFVGQGGTFVFNTVFGDDSSPSDKVVIAGNSSGTGNIVVNNINGTGAQTGEGIQLISVGGSSDASFVMPGRATAGIYEYLLYKGGVANPNDGAWYLRSTYTGDP
ncbi:MAG: autotransporter outer membrane beta-barrel domain-containing protein, partial [Stenotrophomonas maltophilia]